MIKDCDNCEWVNIYFKHGFDSYEPLTAKQRAKLKCMPPTKVYNCNKISLFANMQMPFKNCGYWTNLKLERQEKLKQIDEQN